MTGQVFTIREEDETGSGTLIIRLDDLKFAADEFCIEEIKAHKPEDFENVNNELLETIYFTMDALRISFETKPSIFNKALAKAKKHKETLESILPRCTEPNEQAQITKLIENDNDIINEIKEAIKICIANNENLWTNENIIRKILWNEED